MVTTQVARLTTEAATHRLYRDREGYLIETEDKAGKLVAHRRLTVAEAGEWCDTCRRCGGVVYERGRVA